MEKKISAEDHPNSSEDASSGTVEPYGQTKRGLAPRHVQLMAIGGSIGTALFVGIGNYLQNAGPLSLFLGYLVWGLLFILPTNLSVGRCVHTCLFEDPFSNWLLDLLIQHLVSPCKFILTLTRVRSYVWSILMIAGDGYTFTVESC